ncbi:hypothetical protein [Rhodohalobacter mucosus]|uniref:Uncharacterized protein n=1 Tax=Rhodohalobacter mucosus TaxID=2079485 RepID=A0A316TQ10_9BACT|nr:hypothetical protein [Rhodohalobacter mucosus]PWN06713.1 hypothetical protein DDZ15_09365 [Rhodohalobacter mucosus]
MNTLFRKSTIILIALFIFVQCSPNDRNESTRSFEELPVLDYQTTHLIGESEQYIPGMLNKIFRLADGSWVVSDYGSTTIEHFTPGGEHQSTVAIEGEGPGEVRPFFFFHQLSDSLVAARQQMSNRLDFYKLNDQGELRHSRTQSPEQGSFIWSDLLPKPPDEILAIEQKDWFADDLNYDAENEYYQTSVMTLDFDLNVIEDSVTTLTLPNPRIFRSEQGGVSVFSVPFRSRDRILPLYDGSYWVARELEQRFEHYDPSHQLTGSFELNVEPRPVERADKEFHLGRIQGERWSDIESRIPADKPLFFDA